MTGVFVGDGIGVLVGFSLDWIGGKLSLVGIEKERAVADAASDETEGGEVSVAFEIGVIEGTNDTEGTCRVFTGVV